MTLAYITQIMEMREIRFGAVVLLISKISSFYIQRMANIVP